MTRRRDAWERSARPLLLALVTLAVAAVVALSGCTGSSGADAAVAGDTSSESFEDTADSDAVQTAAVDEPPSDEPAVHEQASAPDSDERPPLPRLIDLGATKCIPCKKMAPILDELRETKKDYFEVIFIDVWENRDKGKEYGVRVIPTQIFYAADGEELYRHIGFYSRKQILDKWRELGIDVGE